MSYNFSFNPPVFFPAPIGQIHPGYIPVYSAALRYNPDQYSTFDPRPGAIETFKLDPVSTCDICNRYEYQTPVICPCESEDEESKQVPTPSVAPAAQEPTTFTALQPRYFFPQISSTTPATSTPHPTQLRDKIHYARLLLCLLFEFERVAFNGANLRKTFLSPRAIIDGETPTIKSSRQYAYGYIDWTLGRETLEMDADEFERNMAYERRQRGFSAVGNGNIVIQNWKIELCACLDKGINNEWDHIRGLWDFVEQCTRLKAAVPKRVRFQGQVGVGP